MIETDAVDTQMVAAGDGKESHIVYYSSRPQFDLLLAALDPKKDNKLFETLKHNYVEIARQMKWTETATITAMSATPVAQLVSSAGEAPASALPVIPHGVKVVSALAHWNSLAGVNFPAERDSNEGSAVDTVAVSSSEDNAEKSDSGEVLVRDSGTVHVRGSVAEDESCRGYLSSTLAKAESQMMATNGDSSNIDSGEDSVERPDVGVCADTMLEGVKGKSSVVVDGNPEYGPQNFSLFIKYLKADDGTPYYHDHVRGTSTWELPNPVCP